MSNAINWVQLAKALNVLGERLTRIAMDSNLVNYSDDTTAHAALAPEYSNPLLVFPFEVRESLIKEYYEPGMTSVAQRFIEKEYLGGKRFMDLQELINDVYSYAVKKDLHLLAYNILIVLSQLPYQYLGNWASVLAVAATRNKNLDIIELGIRCFENWEDKDACSFLKQCQFSESWLQNYADEVCSNILEDGKDINVLSKKNHTWEMARRSFDSSSNFEGYKGRYSSDSIEDGKQQIISVES